MSRPSYFELAVADVHRAVEFYTKAFGWKAQKFEGEMDMDYYFVQTGEGEGINGGIFPTQDGVTRSINIITVEDVDTAVEKIVAAGGTVVIPKSPIPGIGYFSNCLDSEGILFGVMHNDETVK
jgi:predicted enzyme related to lactoylglutathione lyase